MTDTAEMVAFVEKRLNEEEQVAREADAEPFPDTGFERGTHVAYGLQSTGLGLAYQGHALLWDPARALLEIEAKRERLRLLQVNEARWAEVENDSEPFNAFARGDACGRFNMARRMVALDAAVWRDHSDYDAGWEAP